MFIYLLLFFVLYIFLHCIVLFLQEFFFLKYCLYCYLYCNIVYLYNVNKVFKKLTGCHQVKSSHMRRTNRAGTEQALTLFFLKIVLLFFLNFISFVLNCILLLGPVMWLCCVCKGKVGGEQSLW